MKSARTLMKYRYPIVIRPEFEVPWRATNTIDVLCVIKEGASPTVDYYRVFQES